MAEQLVKEFANGCGEPSRNHDENEIHTASLNHNAGDSFKIALTDSYLGRLEKEAFEGLELEHLYKNPVEDIDSKINVFKSCVQEIFANYFHVISEYDLYKRKYQDILEKNRASNISDMRKYIKDIMDHIRSSDSSIITDCSNYSNESVFSKNEITSIGNCSKGKYPNEDDIEHRQRMVDSINVDIWSMPCIDEQLSKNNLSDSTINDQIYYNTFTSSSNDDMSSVNKESDVSLILPDKEIPIKVSCAKNNLLSNDKIECVERIEAAASKDKPISLLSGLCYFCCRNFRGNN